MTKMTRATTLKILGLLLLSHAAVKAQAMPPQLLELDNFGDFKNNGFSQDLYYNMTFKINDRYTVTPETLEHLTYRDEGKGTFNIEHKYVRVLVSDARLAQISDNWTLGMGYRYVLPTNQPLQQEGSLGVLSFRPALNYKNGGFSATLREIFAVHLLKNAYQVNPSPGKPAAGNTLFVEALEIIPEYDWGGGWSVSVNLNPAFAYNMGGPNGGTHAWKNTLYEEYNFGYQGPATKDFYIGIGLESADIAFDKDFFKNLFYSRTVGEDSKDGRPNMVYAFKIIKSF